MAEQTTYVHSVVLEQYVNKKFKRHKTTSKVQRVKLALLYVDVPPWVSVIKHSTNSSVREPCGDGPGEGTGPSGKQTHGTMRYVYCLVQVGNSGNTQNKMGTRREVAPN